MIEIYPKVLEVGRKFGKVDIEVFNEGSPCWKSNDDVSAYRSTLNKFADKSDGTKETSLSFILFYFLNFF